MAKIDTIALYNAFNDDELIAVFASIRELAAWLGSSVNTTKSIISQVEHGKKATIYTNRREHEKARIYVYR